MRTFVAGAIALTVAMTVLPSSPTQIVGASPVRFADDATIDATEFVVVYDETVSLDTARAAVEAAGGTIVTENTAVGVATISTTNGNFVADASAQAAIDGVARNQVIGEVPAMIDADGAAIKDDQAAADARGAGSSPKRGKRAPKAEPLADLQWDMQQIGATPTGSYKYDQGSNKVLVGIIDTGVDGTHPDIAPNFNTELSRNFTTDIPFDANGAEIDGPCESADCKDPNNVDDDGHGTHVASTIASPINGLGIAGVAPKVQIVNLRAGQDSGYFFLLPSVDALTYAGDIGVDVVNMSYYVDPWLFNCQSNPADSTGDQAEQRTIILAMQRALDYARKHGVTLVSAAGNGATDYTKTIADGSSPDYADVPGEVAYERTIDPVDCISMPSEGRGVISVSSTGPTKRKAYYSDHGNGYVDIAAPGGDAYDTPTGELSYGAEVLAAYPAAIAIANGEVDEHGVPIVPYVIEDCQNGVCAYYQYLQGTSMASPHAVGVVALIISKYGKKDKVHGGLTMNPLLVEAALRLTATKTPCPVPAEFTYTRYRPGDPTTPVVSTATCEGPWWSNGFYGSGIVNALRVTRGW